MSSIKLSACVNPLRNALAKSVKPSLPCSDKSSTHQPDDIQGYVHQLSGLRTLRGDVIGLRDLRYIDLELVAKLEEEVVAATETVSNKTVDYLLTPEALDPYKNAVEEQKNAIGKLAKVTEADATGEALDQAGSELEMLIDVVSNLKIEDATQTTAIIDSISGIYSTLNAVRAELKNKRQSLAKAEGTAQFGAQMKLLGQAVVNFSRPLRRPGQMRRISDQGHGPDRGARRQVRRVR